MSAPLECEPLEGEDIVPEMLYDFTFVDFTPENPRFEFDVVKVVKGYNMLVALVLCPQFHRNYDKMKAYANFLQTMSKNVFENVSAETKAVYIRRTKDEWDSVNVKHIVTFLEKRKGDVTSVPIFQECGKCSKPITTDDTLFIRHVNFTEGVKCDINSRMYHIYKEINHGK